MRMLLPLAVLAFIAGTSSAQDTYSNQENTYRYGGTYSTVTIGTATSCSALCGQDQTCQAWSFRRETGALGSAVCELKSTIGSAVKNPLMTSGINPRLASIGQAAPRRIPSVDTLLGGPVSAPAAIPATNVIGNNTASVALSAPRAFVPTPAPVQQFTPPPPARPFIPAPAVPSPRQRINVPVTQGALPPGAVLRETAPPQISFAPVDALPPPPVQPAQAAPETRILQPQSITIPKKTNSQPPAPVQLDTVPAGTVPRAPTTPQTPYNDLRNQKYPSYSINNDTALTPEEFAAQEEARLRNTIERVEIDGVDLAEDIGEPLVQNPAETRRRSGDTGSGS